MKIYNTMTRKREEFVPFEPGKIKMYVCGPTVYDFFHIGNARPFITFDTFRRYMEYRGYEVLYCQNFTDIDDKMIWKAHQEGITVAELAERYIQEYTVDAERLRIKKPSFQPRATDTIEEIISMISELEKKGFAYVLEDGVYYDVDKNPNYGCLSHIHLDELREGASSRDISVLGKRSSMDFAMWKFKKEGEPAWDSPWGEGRPGWHIECSAMILKHLGTTIDIHGGGQDLIFPHHENEIAQSESVNEAPFVRYWMHNGFINVDNEKMSKSLGNFFTVRDIVKLFDYDVIRFFILSAHYRMPINFSDSLLQAAQNGLDRIRNCFSDLHFHAGDKVRPADKEDTQAENHLKQAIDIAQEHFNHAMDEDLNTADAITAIFELVRDANIACANPNVRASFLLDAAAKIDELLGVLGVPAQKENEKEISDDVLQLLEKRTKAKTDKNFTLADELRDQILVLGYQIKDTSQGPQVVKL